MQLARESGSHEAFPLTRAARGELQRGLGCVPDAESFLGHPRADIAAHGLRNSL